MNLKKFKDAYFGDFYIEQNFLKQGQLLVIEKVSNNQFEFQNRIAAIKKTQKLQHLNIAQIVENKNENISNQYNSVYKNIIKYEYYDNNLKKQFHSRLNTKQYFTTPQIMKFIKEGIQALSYLQSQKLNHGEINPFLLQLKQEDTDQLYSLVIFGRLQGSRNSKKNAINDIKNDLDIYYSPEFFLQLKNHDGQYQVDVYKSDVFSFGLCILEICLMEDIQQIFDKKTITFNNHILNQLLTKVKFIYEDQQLLDMLKQMLEINPEKRLNFLNLQQYLQNYKKQNNNLNQIKQTQKIQQFNNTQMIEPISKKFSTPRNSCHKQSILSHFIVPTGNKNFNNNKLLSRNEYLDHQNMNDFNYSRQPNAYSRVIHQRNYSQSRYDGKEILKKFSVKSNQKPLKNNDFLKLEESYKNFQESQLSDVNQQKQSQNFFSIPSEKSNKDKDLDHILKVFDNNNDHLINKNNIHNTKLQKQQIDPHIPQYVNTFELSMNNKQKNPVSNLKDNNTERIYSDKKDKQNKYNFEIKEVDSILSDHQNLLSTQRRTTKKPELIISNFNVALQQRKDLKNDKRSTVVYYKDNFGKVPSIDFPRDLYLKAQEYKMYQQAQVHKLKQEKNKQFTINSEKFYQDNLENQLPFQKQHINQKEENLNNKPKNQIQNFFCYKKEKNQKNQDQLYQKNLDYFQTNYQLTNNLASDKIKKTSIHDIIQKQQEEQVNQYQYLPQQKYTQPQYQRDNNQQSNVIIKEYNRQQQNQIQQQTEQQHNDNFRQINKNSQLPSIYKLDPQEKISQQQNFNQIQDKPQPFVPITMNYINSNQYIRNDLQKNQNPYNIQKIYQNVQPNLIQTPQQKNEQQTHQLHQNNYLQQDQNNSQYEKLYNDMYRTFRYNAIDQENKIQNQQKDIIQTANFSEQRQNNPQNIQENNFIINKFDSCYNNHQPQKDNEYFVNLQFQKEQKKIQEEIYQSLHNSENLFQNNQQQQLANQIQISPVKLQQDESSNFSFLKNYQQCQKSFEEAKQKNKKSSNKKERVQKIVHRKLERKLLEKKQEPSFQQPISEDISIEEYSDNNSNNEQQNTQGNIYQNVNRNEFPYFNSQNTTLNWEQNFFDRRFEPIKQIKLIN